MKKKLRYWAFRLADRLFRWSGRGYPYHIKYVEKQVDTVILTSMKTRIPPSPEENIRHLMTMDLAHRLMKDPSLVKWRREVDYGYFPAQAERLICEIRIVRNWWRPPLENAP